MPALNVDCLPEDKGYTVAGGTGVPMGGKPIYKGGARGILMFLIPVFVLLSLGCATAPKRNPLPEELYSVSQIPNIPDARYWGDATPPLVKEVMSMPQDKIRRRFPALYGQRITMLAISGGGDEGAFGAGFMNGWTETGTRPVFSVVTGISTGALSAPFVFLGPEYDQQLEEIYTSYSTKDLIRKRSTLNTIKNDSAADTAPLRAMIEKYVDRDLMQAIASEYRKGRMLLISTTNLDAGRPVVWNIGLIASSGAPNALDLIRDAMLASASIPVGFPPTMIEVEANGQRYDEMHVDGGASRQAFLFSLGFQNKPLLQRMKIQSHSKAFLIRNAKLVPKWKSVDRTILAIAGRTSSSMIRAQGIGDLYREYQEAKSFGFEFNLSYIPNDFNEEPDEAFDPEYMRKLFDLGYQLAKQGYQWTKAPPGTDSVP